MGFRNAAVIALTILVLGGCGGGDGSHPSGAVKAYLNALADNDGQKACDLLTLSARTTLVEEAGDIDCPGLAKQFHRFLGADAGRLKDVQVSDGDETGDSTTVTATLKGRSVDVQLERVDGKWRVNTGDVANKLLGISSPG